MSTTQTILVILMKWAFEYKDYFMIYTLFTEFNTGIPNSLLYSLPSRQSFRSFNDFSRSNSSKSSKDKYLNRIFTLFKSSKYIKLSEWENTYGYRYLVL